MRGRYQQTHPERHLTAPYPLADASTLALVVEKPNAHSDYIRSVGFNHNGSQIVSGSDDKTIKVWDAGDRFSNCRAIPPCL